MKNILLVVVFTSLSFLYNAQYCMNAGPSSTADSNIESVSIIGSSGSISYTGCPGNTGVEEFLSQTVFLDAGSLYSIDIQFGTCGGNYSSSGQAWIDFNLDGIFDPSESIGTWEGTPPTPMSTFIFSVPTGAISGQSRMRITQAENESLPLDPCDNFTWGSTTDFSVYIQNGIDCSSYVGDNISEPRIVSSLPFFESHDNSICYSNQNPVYASPDVYYLVLLDPSTIALNISLCGSSFDTFLSVFDTEGNVLGINDDHPDCGVSSKLTANTLGIDSVYVIVDGWSFSMGPYDISINPETLEINEINQNNFKVTPNPATNNIKIKNYKGLINIIDSQGKSIFSQELKINQHIDVSCLSSGLYFIELISNNKKITQKLIIE